jgi:predicted Zn-dependent protease
MRLLCFAFVFALFLRSAFPNEIEQTLPVEKPGEERLRPDPSLTDAERMLAMGFSYAAKGEFKRAKLLFESVRRTHPEWAPVKLALAVMYLKTGEPDKAIVVSRDFLTVEPKSQVARFTLADALLASGDAAAAYSLFEELSRSGMDQPELWFGLAKSAFQLARLSALDLETRFPNSPYVGLLREKSRNYFTGQISASPPIKASSASGQSAEAQYRSALDFEQRGLSAAEHLITGSTPMAPRLTLLAQLYVWMERYSEAITLLDRALQTEPGNGNLWATLGKAQWYDVQFADAEVSLKKAMDLGVKEAEVEYMLGDIYLRRDDARKALPLLSDSVTLDPQSNNARARLGRAYGRLGKPLKEAEELALIPQQSRTKEISYQLWRAYLRVGMPQQAQQAAREYRGKSGNHEVTNQSARKMDQHAE